MAVESEIDQIQKLTLGDFAAIIGTPESEWLDFKRTPYQHHGGALTPRGKWDLAKDVSCFANANGGYLVLGYATTANAYAFGDLATSHTPIAKNVVNGESYLSVIREWVYPAVRNITLAWFPPGDATPLGVLVIRVPAQDHSDKPFIVNRSVSSDGHVNVSWSIHERNGARCEPRPVERIHADLVAVRVYIQPLGRPSELADPVETLNTDLASCVAALGESSADPRPAVCAVQCIPLDDRQRWIPGFYDSVRTLLHRPPSIRQGGFNLYTGSPVEDVEGALVAKWSGTATIARPEGTLSCGAMASPDFLGWAINQNRNSQEGLWLNPLALVEFVLESVRLAAKIAELRSVALDRFTWRICAVNLRSHGVRLEGGRHSFLRPPGAARMASSDEWIEPFDPGQDAEATAFNALERLYGVFGHDRAQIPYTTEQRVDPSLIIAAGAGGS